uniref:SnoaL-like domain-containing protein n=1 Tax=Ascaris lumbricoides TaxID=6252 RepID=A0A0M3HZC5_ASCLU
MNSGVAEFQKLHNELDQLRKAGKHEEGLKHCTSDCYFMTPFRPPYGIKDALEVMKNPKLQPYVNAESKIIVDDVKVSGDVAIDRGHFTLQHEGEKKGR